MPRKSGENTSKPTESDSGAGSPRPDDNPSQDMLIRSLYQPQNRETRHHSLEDYAEGPGFQPEEMFPVTDEDLRRNISTYARNILPLQFQLAVEKAINEAAKEGKAADRKKLRKRERLRTTIVHRRNSLEDLGCSRTVHACVYL